MSLRATLLEALYDRERLRRCHEGSCNAVAFASRVIRDCGASFIPVCQERETLTSALEQYGWVRGGIAPAVFFETVDGTLGFLGRVSVDRSWAHGFTFADLPESEWRPYRQTVTGLRTWLPPG